MVLGSTLGKGAICSLVRLARRRRRLPYELAASGLPKTTRAPYLGLGCHGGEPQTATAGVRTCAGCCGTAQYTALRHTVRERCYECRQDLKPRTKDSSPGDAPYTRTLRQDAALTVASAVTTAH